MARHDDLAELHALAASIAQDADGWRARHRRRAADVAELRAGATVTAPVRRHRRHRLVAGAVLGVAAAAAAAAVALAGPAARPPVAHAARAADPAPAGSRLGRQAAMTLVQQGRNPDPFACEVLFDQLHLAPTNQAAAFRSDYLTACADGAGSAAEER